MADTFVVVMQVILAALLAWGGWLCLFARDRREGGDRRSTVRGGRRRGEGAVARRPAEMRPAAPMAGRRIRALTG